MLSRIRNIVEKVVLRDSIPSLIRCSKYLPRAAVRRIQEEAFRTVVRYTASRQRFLARKLKEYGIDAARVRRPSDLGEIFTTPDDLLRNPPEDFICRPPQAVFETTGTSGTSKRVYFGYDELDLAARYEAAALYENGVRPEDRVVCAFDSGYWISSWVTFFACRQLGILCSAIGKLLPQEVYGRLRNYRYNVIIADPTWLVSLSEIAEREGTLPIKVIFAAGDRMTDAYRNYVQDVWKAPVILGYGSTEAGGGIGMECRQRDGYHVDEYNFLFEIVDPDEEGHGELVMTTLSRRTMPLIRYRMRDITRFNKEPCPCGIILRKIAKIKGRRDEMVVMGAGNMHPEIFERILAGVEGVTEAWQVAVRQEELRDTLEFRLELSNGVSPSAVQEAVSKNLKTLFPEVWANHLCGMYKLAFRFPPPGTLGLGRKPRRLIDERAN